MQSLVTSDDDSEDNCRRKTSSSFRICEFCMSKNYWDHQLCRLRVAPDAMPILKNFVVSFNNDLFWLDYIDIAVNHIDQWNILINDIDG